MSAWNKMVEKLKAACDYQCETGGCNTYMYDRCQGEQDCLWCSEVVEIVIKESEGK